MKLVIEISKSDYEYIKKLDRIGVGECLIDNVYEGIRKGTPLPKGHGRLGDLDELEQRISNFVEHDTKITDEYTVIRQRFIVDGIRQTLTIIEADGGGKNEVSD